MTGTVAYRSENKKLKAWFTVKVELTDTHPGRIATRGKDPADAMARSLQYPISVKVSLGTGTGRANGSAENAGSQLKQYTQSLHLQRPTVCHKVECKYHPLYDGLWELLFIIFKASIPSTIGLWVKKLQIYVQVSRLGSIQTRT